MTGYEVHGWTGALENGLAIVDLKVMAALMMAAWLTIWKLHTRAVIVACKSARLSQSLASKARF